MRKTFIPTISLLAITIFYSLIGSLLSPSITIHNNTEDIIYVYPGYSTFGVELEPEEVDQLKKLQPIKIEPNDEVNITASLKWLYRDNVRLDIGWNIGGRYESTSHGGGGQPFRISKDSGWCSALITVNTKRHTLKKQNNFYCYKKLTPFTDQYN